MTLIRKLNSILILLIFPLNAFGSVSSKIKNPCPHLAMFHPFECTLKVELTLIFFPKHTKGRRA